MAEATDDVAARYDEVSKRRAGGEKIKLTPAEAIEFVGEFRRRQKPMSHEEFWDIMREARRHSCDKYYEEKWDREDQEKGSEGKA